MVSKKDQQERDEFDKKLKEIEEKSIEELTADSIREHITGKYTGAPADIEAVIKEQTDGDDEHYNPNYCGSYEDHDIEMLNFSLLERTLRETRKSVYQVYDFKWISLTVGHTCPFDLHFIGLYNSLKKAQKKIDESATPEYVKRHNLKFKILPHQKAYPMLFIEGIEIHTVEYQEFGEMFPELSENPQSKFIDNPLDKCIFYETQGMHTPTVKKISSTKPLAELPESVRKIVSEHLESTGLELKALQ